jgi:LmbE family N-acetylglucosaminyl deacetylase
MYKKLVIAPHADDEVLGPGGILDSETFVYFVGIDESMLPGRILSDTSSRISMEERKKEIDSVAKHFGFDYEINYDNKVNNYHPVDLINQFEELVNKVMPEMVFIPCPSYNQDHRAIYQASRTALRPHDKNFFVKKVLLYEQPHALMWNDFVFKPNYFVSIDIKRKIEGYKLHKSQVRGMRSFDMLESMAIVRGKSANSEYAEAYQIERWVE